MYKLPWLDNDLQAMRFDRFADIRVHRYAPSRMVDYYRQRLNHAAAGGVGTFAVQMAQAWGATVIGPASEYKHDYLRSLGVVPVTYGDGLVNRVRSLTGWNRCSS